MLKLEQLESLIKTKKELLNQNVVKSN